MNSQMLVFVVLAVSLFLSSGKLLVCQEGVSSVPLVEALKKRKLDDARTILRSSLAKLNVSDQFGNTPLLQAIRSGFSDFANELLLEGADPNFTVGGGDTPLMVASWYGDLTIAQELLNRGALVNGTNH